MPVPALVFALRWRGTEFGHSCNAKAPSAASTVFFCYYAFLSDGDDVLTHKKFEAAGHGAVKMLVVRYDKSQAICGCMVPTKGIDEKGCSFKFPVEDVKWLLLREADLQE